MSFFKRLFRPTIPTPIIEEPKPQQPDTPNVCQEPDVKVVPPGHCPQCKAGPDKYKSFRLGSDNVHKCTVCGHQDYESPPTPTMPPVTDNLNYVYIDLPEESFGKFTDGGVACPRCGSKMKEIGYSGFGLQDDSSSSTLSVACHKCKVRGSF